MFSLNLALFCPSCVKLMSFGIGTIDMAGQKGKSFSDIEPVFFQPNSKIRGNKEKPLKLFLAVRNFLSSTGRLLTPPPRQTHDSRRYSPATRQYPVHSTVQAHLMKIHASLVGAPCPRFPITCKKIKCVHIGGRPTLAEWGGGHCNANVSDANGLLGTNMRV